MSLKAVIVLEYIFKKKRWFILYYLVMNGDKHTEAKSGE